MKCALVVGHQKQSQGATNKFTGMSEFIFNEQLAKDIKAQVNTVDIDIIYRKTYQQLPSEINDKKPDFIICLHCNAYNTKATGTETLYHYGSARGKIAAQILQQHLLRALQLKDRGIKPKSVEDRGGYVLKYTNAPCIIAEPFFIDNDHDLKRAINNRIQLTTAYANAITIINLSAAT